MPIEITLLAWSVALLLVHIALQGQTATARKGIGWNAGPRDDDGGSDRPGKLEGRAARALSNFLETYPAFVALALAVTVTNRAGGLAASGAVLWFVARIIYVPLYLFGVPYVRSLVWLVSIAGLLMMAARLI